MEEFAGFPLDRSGSDSSDIHRSDRRQTKRRTKSGTIYRGSRPPASRDDSGRHDVGAFMQNAEFHSAIALDQDSQGFPVAEAVFMDFSRTVANRLDLAMKAPVMYKVLQHGADAAFDQLLATMRAVSQFAVSAGCKRLLTWRRMQIDHMNTGAGPSGPFHRERCKIAIDYIFCRGAIEILSEHGENETDLPDDIATELAILVFNSVVPEPGSLSLQSDDRDSAKLTRLFAQLLSNVARTRFELVSAMFFRALSKADSDPTSYVALIGSMAFMPLKLYPIDDLEQGFKFLEECGKCLKSANGSKIRHAWAGLLVELLTPIAAIVKLEVNLPVVRSFVDAMYQYLLELLKKSKHLSAILPLTTAVISIAQKDFFLDKWPAVLSICLATLKHSRSSLQEVVAECTVRLTWVYTVRSSTESNQVTQMKLKLIADSFFPGGKQLAPRHLSAKVFVRLIVYMAQGHFDFTLRQVVLNLLSVDSGNKISNYDRVAIGVRGFLVIANNQEIDEGPPLAPLLYEMLPSGHSVRPKTELLTKLLTRDTSMRLGLAPYLQDVQKKLLRLLQILDLQITNTYIRTNPAMEHRANMETFSRECSLALDLLKTCLIAVPRCLPLTEYSFETVGILFRCTISIDEELRKIATATLQTLILDRADLRLLIVWHYVEFVVNKVPVSQLSLHEDCLRTLLKFLNQWKKAVVAAEEAAEKEEAGREKDDDDGGGVGTAAPHDSGKMPVVNSSASAALQRPPDKPFRMRSVSEPVKSDSASRAENRRSRHSMRKIQAQIQQGEKTPKLSALTAENLLCMVEGVCLASLLCPRASTRKTCLFLLKQIRDLRDLLKIQMSPDASNVYTLIYDAVPDEYIQRRAESLEIQSSPELGSEVLFDATAEQSPQYGSLYTLAGIESNSFSDDIWLSCLADIIQSRLIGACNSAIEYSWLCTCRRLAVISSILGVGPRNDVKSGATSFLPDVQRKDATRALMGTCTAISAQLPILLSIDDDSLVAVPTPFGGEDSFCHKRYFQTAAEYMKFSVSLLQGENHDVQDLALFSLRWIDRSSYAAFSDELQPLVQDSLSLRSESSKKKKRRDRLRIVVARVHTQTSATAGGCLRDTKSATLLACLAKYITGTRSYLEMEGENDLPDLDMLRMHFTVAISSMCREIKDLTLYSQLFTDEVRTDLFALFSIWCEASLDQSGSMSFTDELPQLRSELYAASIRQRAVEAIAALCRGPVFHREESVAGRPPYLLKWLEAKLASPEEESRSAATEALLHLLEGNQDAFLYGWAIHLCYTADVAARKQVFLALVNVHEKSSVFREHRIPNLCLALHMLADECHETHVEARRMLALLVKQHYDAQLGEEFPLIYSSAVQATRTYYQTIVGQYLASRHPQTVLHMLPELFKRFLTTSARRQQQLVQCVVPWLEVLNLTTAASQIIGPSLGAEQVSAAQVLLSNLMYLYTLFSTDLPLDCLWKALLVVPGNLKCTIDYLVFEGDSRTPNFTRFAQEVCTIMAEVDAQSTVEILVEHIETQLGTVAESPPPVGVDDDGGTFISRFFVDAPTCCPGLDELLPRTPARIPPLFSCSLWLVGEIIARQPTRDWGAQIPTILHYACLGLDHPNHSVHLQSKVLVLNLLLVSMSKLEAVPPKLDRIAAFLREDKAGKLLSNDTAPATQVPTELDLATFVLDLCSILEPVAPGLAASWSAKAHACATSCAICYYAGRSFQILRIFRADASQKSLDAMLVRLADSAADQALDIQHYTQEILLTLDSMVEHAGNAEDSQMVVPYIFWTAVSMLESDFEQEFTLAIRIIARIEATRCLDNPGYIALLSRLYQQFDWEPDYAGFYILLCKGMASSMAGAQSLTLCRSLLMIHGDPVLDPTPEASFTCAVVVMLIAVVFDFESRPDAVCEGARAVADVAMKQGARLVSRMFSLYADDTYFRAKENWIKDLCKHFSKECLPANEQTLFTVLVGAFTTGDPQFRDTITSILIPLIPKVTNPKTFALFNAKLIPAILDIVDRGKVDMALLVDAIASACARTDQKAPAPLDDKYDSVCVRLEPGWDRPIQSQGRVRDRLKKIMKTLGLMTESQGNFFRNSTGSAGSTSATEDTFNGSFNASDGTSGGEMRVSQHGFVVEEDTLGEGRDLDVAEERFFEDFDFLDEFVEQDRRQSEPCPAPQGPNTTMDSDGSEGSPDTLERWKRRAPSLDSGENEADGISNNIDMQSRRSSLSRSVPAIDNSTTCGSEPTGASSPRSRPVSVHSASALLGLQPPASIALTAENLQSLSRVSVTSSTRSADDLPHEPAQELVEQYVHVADEAAYEHLRENVDQLVLDSNPDSSKIIWQVARKAAKATVELHLKFIQEDMSKSDLPLLAEVTASAESLLGELILPYVYVDTAVMRNGDLIELMRMLVLELLSTIGVYRQEKEQCTKLIGTLEKLVALASDSQVLEDQMWRIMLCATKMNLQMSTVIGSYASFVDVIMDLQADARVTNFSTMLTENLHSIQQALKASEGVQAKRIDTSSLSKLRAVQYLQDNLGRKRVKQSIALLRAFRKSWPADVFGHTDSDDMDVLIAICANVNFVEGTECIGVASAEPSLSVVRAKHASSLVQNHKIALKHCVTISAEPIDPLAASL